MNDQANMHRLFLMVTSLVLIVLCWPRVICIPTYGSEYSDLLTDYGDDYEDDGSILLNGTDEGVIDSKSFRAANRDASSDQDYGPMDPAELAIDYQSNRFPLNDTVSVAAIEHDIIPCPNSADLSCKFREACGRAPLNKLTAERDGHMAPYIINGDLQTTPGQWPSYVQLWRRKDYDTFERCGGTLVSDRHVLTAASCTYWLPETEGRQAKPEDIAVSLGRYDIYGSQKGKVLLRAKSMCVSKKYNSTGTVNDDWALLELERPVEFTDRIQPACLPFEPVERAGKLAQCYTMGIGLTYEPDRPKPYWPSIPKFMRIEQVTCKAYGLSDRDRSRECFAKARRHRGSSCYGDSGGPALCLDARGRWTVVGVTSYMDDEPGHDCGARGPKAWKTVFARVRTLLGDIKEQCHF